MQDLKLLIGNNAILSHVLDSGLEAYLVGGFLRDVVRGTESMDIDFVVRGNFHKAASSFSSRFQGKLIEFSRQNMVRVVLGKLIVDFTELKGELENDLKKRDFTMNAMAWSPRRGLIDPMKGTKDIAARIIRGIARDNFVDDPLRLLRAYRFAGELCWNIDAETRATIRELKAMISRPSRERITVEFFKLIDSKCCLKGLKTAFLDGLLNHILSINSNILEECIQEISLLRDFLKKIPEKYNFRFDEVYSQGLSYGGLLQAEVILSKADLSSGRLLLGGSILKRTHAIAQIRKDCYGKKLDRDRIFDISMSKGDCLLDFAFLSKQAWLVRDSLKCLKLRPLLTGEEIMEATKLKGGPELGSIVRNLRRMQFLQEIRTKSAAKLWLRRRVGNLI